MSDDIKKLIQRLRATFFGERDFSLHDVRDAADALERLVAERDRLKAALVRLRDCDWVISLPDRMDAVREIAREVLEAKE